MCDRVELVDRILVNLLIRVRFFDQPDCRSPETMGRWDVTWIRQVYRTTLTETNQPRCFMMVVTFIVDYKNVES